VPGIGFRFGLRADLRPCSIVPSGRPGQANDASGPILPFGYQLQCCGAASPMQTLTA